MRPARLKLTLEVTKHRELEAKERLQKLRSLSKCQVSRFVMSEHQMNTQSSHSKQYSAPLVPCLHPYPNKAEIGLFLGWQSAKGK